jgi:hypothetical protein
VKKNEVVTSVVRLDLAYNFDTNLNLNPYLSSQSLMSVLQVYSALM